MKRAASTSAYEPIAKKTRLIDDVSFDDQELQRTPSDLLEHGLVDESGYLSCTCFMTWKPTKKHKAILQSHMDGSHADKFEVEFSEACAEFFPEIELKARDELLLALKGAKLEVSSNVSRLCNLRMKLSFQDGVIMKFLNRGEGSRTVNTWQLKQNLPINGEDNEDAWFLTPKNSKVLDLGKAVRQGISPETLLRPNRFTLPSLEAFISESFGNADAGLLTLASPTVHPPIETAKDEGHNHELKPSSSNLIQPEGKRLRKKKQKQLRKKEQMMRLAAENSNNSVPPDVTAETALFTPNGQPIPFPATAPPESHDTGHISPDAAASSELLNVDLRPSSIGVAGFSLGFVADFVRYYPLKNDLPANTPCNVIGIVVAASMPSTTRTGEWMCNVKLADPSNTEADNLNASGSFKINCFDKKYKEWLPRPSLGEILIMQDMKISLYHDNPMGIGYGEKVKWAIYSPASGKIGHGYKGSAPESEVLADGFGYEFSPFLHPGPEAINYCRKLAEWWRGVEEKRKEITNAHQVVNSSSSFNPYIRTRRQHRNISEASPNAPPDGYFDCTIEMLHGYMNDNGVYSLYVTDYTLNEAITAAQADWCPAGLAEYVLKIEVWDAAVPAAQSMCTGEYYSIKNARMLLSRGGYLEGKLVEPKIQKLVEGEGLADQYLTALLERKKAWQEQHAVVDKPNEFEYSTIGAATERQHFNCFVEILHVLHDGDSPCIYVTDYTARDELLSTKAQGSWAKGLEGRILKIGLFNSQVEVAKSIQEGSFYNIKKLRVKSSTTSRQFQGHLGGTERLIFQHSPGTGDDRLDELRQRKEEWKRGLETQLPSEINTVRKTARANRRFKTIAQLKIEGKCTNKSRIYARVLDFRPWDLREAVIIHCTKCNLDLRAIEKACFKCHDTDHEYVRYMYQLYLLLQDESGDQLYVSVHDDSLIFKGLRRGDIRENLKAYLALNDRLAKMLGNLLETHKHPTPKDGSSIIPSDGPMLSMIVDSWEAGEKRAYCLADCEDLDLA